ncbi:MAG: TIGR03013 family PEP-CTERM/XrtA system glycosyltransferase [Azoarcus sp.]|jgi:sugar transferase (PEP-CTERM system associated)|nr:TIGR03013 family PEP-CTERM/XrtA system glycosyltransferase [Azoarcus sp.]
MLKVFSHYFPMHVVQRLCLDLLLFVVAVVALAAFRARGPELEVDWHAMLPSTFGFAVTVVVVNFALGLYRPVDEDSPHTALARLVLAFIFCLPAAYFAMLMLPWFGFASLWMQAEVLVMTAVILSLRVLINRKQASSLFAPRILVVGTGEDALEVQRILLHPEQGNVEVQAFYPAASDGEPKVDAEKIVADGSLSEVASRLRIDEIIVAMRERRGGALPLRELLNCKLDGIHIFDLSTFYERVRRQVRLDSLRASWLIYGDGFQQPLQRVFFKRLFDLVVAAGLFVVTLPLNIVVAFMILFEDGGPVFYRQERVGQGGRVFRVVKFRSMKQDAEKDGTPRWAESNDARITRVGRFIRRLRIDELPQLVNVLLGDMSLVGPRPERPFFVDQLAREIPFYGIRHCVKPGLTGWAQVRYQYGASRDDAVQKLQYDLYYVKNHTLVLDTLVLLETVRVVLMGEGAH